MGTLSYKNLLILASASPRRHALLQQVGIDFEIQPSQIDETIQADEAPKTYVERMSRSKAKTIAETHNAANLYVLGADTIVVCDETIFGKPRNSADATQMIKKLSGRTHYVLTSISLFKSGGHFLETRTNQTAVTFKNLQPQQINDYVAMGESLDKAGGYGIQGFASAMITEISGCYFNVMGLPLSETVDLLLCHGVIQTWP